MRTPALFLLGMAGLLLLPAPDGVAPFSRPPAVGTAPSVTPRPDDSPPPLEFVAEPPPARDVLWAIPAVEPEFADFQRWAAQRDGDPETGVHLAASRRAALRSLIARDPKRALELAVPEAVRRALPPQVAALLEEKVDARGNLEVLARSAPRGAKLSGPVVSRRAVLPDGKTWEAYTYGGREYIPSLRDIPLHGIAVDGRLALSEWPGRVLEPVELAEAKQALVQDPVCPTSQQPTAFAGTETAILTGMVPEIYCRPAHAFSVLKEAAVAERRPPDLAAVPPENMVAASNGAGQTVPNWLPSGDPLWTRGTKRIGVVRVKFAGQTYQNFSVADCEEILTGIRSAWGDWSCGRCTVANTGASGSWVSPVLNLPYPASHYVDLASGGDGVTEIFNAALVFADEQGRGPDTLDFVMVLAGDAPIRDAGGGAVTWTGVGGVGAYGWERGFLRSPAQVGVSIVRVDDVQISIVTALHELGHNLGLYHSSSLLLAPNAEGETLVEYGDYYCTMGSGDEAYNTRYKHWLGWLDDVNVPYAFSSGNYTILEHDHGEKSGVRGLQVPFLTTYNPLADLSLQSLFVELRTGIFHRDDISVHLSPNASARVWLLETNADSGALTLSPGRTLSCSAYGETLHITNVNTDGVAGRAQIFVQRGTPPGNDAPSGTISASTPVATPDQDVVFTANFSDADGDALAYYWTAEYPGGRAPVGGNDRAVSRSFTQTGPVTITCVVSDMRGGTRTATLLLNVVNDEPPVISAIGPQTINEDGALAGGIPFTVSDTVTPAASLTVTATADNPALFPPGSLSVTSQGGGNRRVHGVPAANQSGEVTVTLTVSDGTFTSVERFRVTVVPATPGTLLIASGATWRYRDAVAAPSANWKNSGFNDAAWSQGAGPFVYSQGANAGATTLATPASARMACYFRRQFTPPIVMTGTLNLKLQCDDGAVVYANGTEVYRLNMPADAVSHTSAAEASVEGDDEKEWTIIPLANSVLNPGTLNTLAVEVHDSGRRGDGDVTFDCELGLFSAPVIGTISDKVSIEDVDIGPHVFTAADFESPPGVLTFRATSSNQALIHDSSLQFGVQPGTGNPTLSMVPVRNANGSAVITIHVSDGSSVASRSFTQTVVALNDPPVIAALPDMAAVTGQPVPVVLITTSDVDSALSSLTFSAVSSNTALVPAAGVQLVSNGTDGQRWLRLTPVNGATGETTITVTAQDGSVAGGETFRLRIAAPQSPAATDIRLAEAGERWNYWVNAAPAGWNTQGFDDSAWPGGRGRLGYGGDGEVTTVPATPYRMTTYFRRAFLLPNPAAVVQFKIRLQRDDGVVLFLNGAELMRTNMPAGAIAPGTAASAAVDTTDAEQLWASFTLPASGLVAGSNTLAAEVHQRTLPTAAVPGDLGFDLQLSGTPSTPGDTDVLIAAGDTWHYWDAQSYPDEHWVQTTYVESGWKEGRARIGYAIGGESTIPLSLNSAGTGRNPSVLFRKVFDVAWPEAYRFVHLFLQRDDGAVVYLNGSRILLDNVGGNTTPAGFAVAETPAADRLLWRHFLVNPNQLLTGRNLLAIAVHQVSAADNDLAFDLELTGELSDDLPPLFMSRSGGVVELSWPSAWNAWSLEASTSLGTWSAVTAPVFSYSGWNYVFPPGAPARRFFRLHR